MPTLQSYSSTFLQHKPRWLGCRWIVLGWINSAMMTSHYIGLPGCRPFKALFDYTETNMSQPYYKHVTEDQTVSNRPYVMPLADGRFVFLVKIRQNLTEVDLSVHFNVSHHQSWTWTHRCTLTTNQCALSKDLQESHLPDLWPLCHVWCHDFPFKTRLMDKSWKGWKQTEGGLLSWRTQIEEKRALWKTHIKTSAPESSCWRKKCVQPPLVPAHLFDGFEHYL